MFAQVFLEFSNLSPCCERRKVVAVSEHTDVFDGMFVQARIEHSNVTIQFLSKDQNTKQRLSFRTLHG